VKPARVTATERELDGLGQLTCPRTPKIEGMVKLSQPEIASAVRKLGGWTVANGKLHRDYEFADFVHAFGFMTTAALTIEKMGHHPEWFNVYNRLSVDLTTHDAGGITKKDIALAKKLETLAAKLI
jgi:4a-hydroxytetrahydrobiopterin dehydratase